MIGTTGTASANAPCGSSAPADLDHSSYVRFGDGGPVRTGSSSDCAVVGHADPGETLDYYCWTWNAAHDHTWTYLRNVTGGALGWVRDDHLSDGGSVTCCGF